MLELLEKVYEERTDEMLVYLKVGPGNEHFHLDPRFLELMRKVGLLEWWKIYFIDIDKMKK